jgi:hypothetical protein
MSQMNIDRTSLSIRPDAAATRGMKDNVGMLMGDDSCKEVPQSIQTKTSINYMKLKQ